MIENILLLLLFTILMFILSPFLAIIERTFFQLGAILMIFILGIIILSSPMILTAGVILIIASSSTVNTGIYLIIFSILAPLLLIPLLSELNVRDFLEMPGLLFFANAGLVLAIYSIIGPTNPIFIVSLITATTLVIGDLMSNKLLR